jgi:hypothetical protein
MRGARFYGDNFGEQMKNYNGGGGTGIQMNQKRITRSNRFLLEIFFDTNIETVPGIDDGFDFRKEFRGACRVDWR